LGFSATDITTFRDAFLYSGKSSVDAFLEHRIEFLDIGKAAIAETLITWERPEVPYTVPNNWLMYLYARMNSEFDEFGTNPISFITFNYDRLLEYFLFTSLYNTYGKGAEDCSAVLRVGFESHEARAIRRARSMTEAA
jgi:hypothetical protein